MERIVQSKSSQEGRHPSAMNHIVRQKMPVAIIGCRGAAITQRKLSALIQLSPQVSAGEDLRTMIHHSTRMVGQRKQVGHMFRAVAQQKAAPEEDELLQGKFNKEINSVQSKDRIPPNKKRVASDMSVGSSVTQLLNIPPIITHKTTFAAPDGSANTRRNVGVGEEVTFAGNTAGNWSATAGTPTKVAKKKSFTWTAPDRAAAVTMKLTAGGKEGTVKMTVIEPDSITATKNSELYGGDTGAGAGMKLTLNYHPKKVSFGNVEAKEVSGAATDVSGYFSEKYTTAFIYHNSGDTFYPIGVNNEDTAEDTASFPPPMPIPYKPGKFEWVIPNHFKVKTEGGDGKKFTDVTQAFSIDAIGKVKITKAGAEVERSP